ncbi:uncharacterized, partial [Tachysurus ichikawai]
MFSPTHTRLSSAATQGRRGGPGASPGVEFILAAG